MSRRVYLTTEDNPFDPATEFASWFTYDIAHQYNTCQLINRHADTSSALSDDSNAEAIERAIDEIIRLHGSEGYKKVVVETNESDYLPNDDENLEN